MNVSLTGKLKDHVQERVADGNYTSASDYVRDLIRADMARPDKLENLRRLVREGTDALDRGEGIPLTKELLEDIKARGRAELDSQHG